MQEVIAIPSEYGREGGKGKYLDKFYRYSSQKKIFVASPVIFLICSIFHIIEDQWFSDPSSRMDLKYSIIRTLPLKTYSKLLGSASCIPLVYPINGFILYPISVALGINLREAEKGSIFEYSTLNELFTRKLRKGARRVKEGVTSPADGTILYAGLAGGTTGKIKGIEYKESEFLGISSLDDVRKYRNSRMYQIVIYLAPGDYHRFHSFFDVTIDLIKHVPSELFSVSRLPMKYLKGLLTKNERVVMSGATEFGYASLVAVGSTGVGSIESPLAALRTNKYFGRALKPREYRVKAAVGKGSELGHFNLGSTVVVYFEVPLTETFEIRCTLGPIRVGETLGVFIRRSQASAVKDNNALIPPFVHENWA